MTETILVGGKKQLLHEEERSPVQKTAGSVVVGI